MPTRDHLMVDPDFKVLCDMYIILLLIFVIIDGIGANKTTLQPLTF